MSSDRKAKRTAHARLRVDTSVLHVSVARVFGYRWRAEHDPSTVLAPEQRELVARCDALLSFADAHGIVCIPSVRSEPPAAERMSELLSTSYSNAWSDDIQRQLLTEAGHPTLDDWLRDGFSEQHCKLFHHRPFIWRIWDGRKRDGFHVLVTYHRLTEANGRGRQCLAALTYRHLGDWLSRQEGGVKQGEGGAEAQLTAATLLQGRLEAILEGKPPFDIFVRRKPIREQPVGSNPDVNDGVRLDIRPFMTEDFPGAKKGAGILRYKPNIMWGKDRGKEDRYAKGRRQTGLAGDGLGIHAPEELRPEYHYPWFWEGGGLLGNRVNNIHPTLAKRS